MTTEHFLSESLEDYLEIILELQTMNSVARSKDIAEKLNIRLPGRTIPAGALVNKQP